MRISVWCPDVGSSDLVRSTPCCATATAACSGDASTPALLARSCSLPAFPCSPQTPGLAVCQRGSRSRVGGRHQDRKSVVSGKRGSCGVDLWGRIIINKKNHTNTKNKINDTKKI